MKPSKTAYATKKKPARRKRNPNDLGNPMVGKLLDLKYRINDHYKAVGGKIDTNTDKSWVMSRIDGLRNGVVSLDRQDMETANELWRKYR